MSLYHLRKEHSHVIVVHILLRYGHLRIVLQMGTHPVDGVINLRACSQWVLWLSQRICVRTLARQSKIKE